MNDETAPDIPAATDPGFIAEDLRGLAVDMSTLVLDPANARRHPERNMDSIKGSLALFGQRKPIVCNRRGRVIIAGNGTYQAAKALGWTRLAVVWVDDDTAMAAAYGIADNRTGELAEWDDTILGTLVSGLAASPVDMEKLGFTAQELDNLIGNLDPEKEDGSNVDAPEPREQIVSKRGEVYDLGPHRLMCGDSTSPEDWSVLMRQDKAGLILTDPPYCSGGFQEAGKAAGSIGSEQSKTGGKFAGGIANDKLSSRGYMAMLKRVFECVDAPACYVFTDWRMWINLSDVVESSGYCIKNMIVWDKGTPGMGRGWRTQHELVMFGAKETVAFDNHDAVGNVLHSKRTGNELHPTQKPVDIIETIVGLHRGAKIVVDPFAGSGTTLMACASHGRAFRGLELSPGFCDVIRRRWGTYAKENDLTPGKDALSD